MRPYPSPRAERLLDEDGHCPAHDDPDDSGGCSAGKIGDYTSAKAAENGWTLIHCNGKDAPSHGCKDAWDRNMADPKNCWFGRGATQLSWPGNYDMVRDAVVDAGGEDICNNPDSICDEGAVAWLTAIAYWKNNEGPWIRGELAFTCKGSLQVIRPADGSSNTQRCAQYDEWLEKLDIDPSQVTTPEPGPGGVCTGEPCDPPWCCRSKWDYCGNSDDYCKDAIWTCECPDNEGRLL